MDKCIQSDLKIIFGSSAQNQIVNRLFRTKASLKITCVYITMNWINVSIVHSVTLNHFVTKNIWTSIFESEITSRVVKWVRNPIVLFAKLQYSFPNRVIFEIAKFLIFIFRNLFYNPDNKCDYCGATFTTKQCLNGHQSMHEGILYCCLICNNYKIARKNSMQMHLRLKHSDLLGKNMNWDSVKKYVKVK